MSVVVCMLINLTSSVVELNAGSLTNDMPSRAQSTTQQASTPPKAVKKPITVTLHNDTRVDPYAWLRDTQWPDITDTAILAYLEAEKTYTEAQFAPLSDIQEQLYQELKGRIPEEDSSYPIKENDFLYYTRTETDKEYTIHCRKHIGSQDEEILLDENALAQGHEFFSLGVYEFSHDHQRLAYSTDISGQERYTMRIKDLKTGTLLPDVLENTSGESVVWHKHLNGFFYVGLNDKLRADRLFFHKLGDTQDKDQLIYQEKDDTFSAGVRYASDRRYAFLELSSSDTHEQCAINLEGDSLTPQIIIPRRQGHLYTADHLGNDFYVLTNDKGSNFRLIRAAVDKLASGDWEELVAHDPAIYRVNFALYNNHLVLRQIEDGLPKIKVSALDTNLVLEDIPFKTEASYDATVEFTHFADPYVRLHYSSLATPATVFEYNLVTKEMCARKTQRILGGFDASNYQVERIKAPSKDGTMVPISLVYRKSLKKVGGNPLVQYGYGAYGMGMDAGFSSKIISLLDRGFIYAIAHVRGGNDMGYPWYEDGKLLNKRHTFEDFIACSEHLIEKGYTTKKNIAIFGASAGGILMGYCANERPDLYRAIVARVPFVDVLNTMLDADLPLTPGEYKEWGNPKEETYYHYIKSYSPYDNVKAQDYPHMYVTAGLNDPRVTYWEPTKWVAKLRDLKTDHNMLVLDIKMGAGHFGPSGRYGYLKEEAAKYYAFLLHAFGLAHA